MSMTLIKKLLLPFLLIVPMVAVAYTHDVRSETEQQPVEDEPSIVQPVIVQAEEVDRERYDDLVYKYGEIYNVDPRLMNAIISCENMQRIPTLQSKLYYNFTNSQLGIFKGERERSFGLVQINLDYNPTITYEQATDPEFSIEFLAKNLSKGRHSWWASYTSGCYLRYM